MDAYTNINFTPELLKSVMDFPAGQPPPGVTPDFDHQASNALMLWITCGICVPIMLLAAAGKFWVRFTTGKKRLTWGDVVFTTALLGTLSWIILSFVAVEGKFFGRHMWEIKLKFIDKRTILLSITSESFWPIWFLLIKISLFAMYLELFGVKRWLRWGCYGGMVFLTGFHVAAGLFYAISCSPRGGQDDMAYLLGFLSKRCLSIFPIIIMQAAVNIVGDVYLLILPLPAVWSLNMPLKKKLGICAMFFTGLTGIAASACSLYYRIKLHSATDLTWLCIVPWVTSVYEMMAGIVVCCMPSLTALARRWVPPLRAFMSSSEDSHVSSSSQQSRLLKKPMQSISSIFRRPRRYPKLQFVWVSRSEELPSSINSSSEKHGKISSNFTDSFDSQPQQKSYGHEIQPVNPYQVPYQTVQPNTEPGMWEPLPQLKFQRQSQVSSRLSRLSLLQSFFPSPSQSPSPSRSQTQLQGQSPAHSPLQPQTSPYTLGSQGRTWISPNSTGVVREPIAVHESHIANAAIQKRTDFEVHVYDEENRF